MDTRIITSDNMTDSMEDRTFRTRELEASGRPTDYVVWFRLPDDSRLTVEMSLAGLLKLQGLVKRAVDSLAAMSPDELNGYVGERGEQATVARS